MCLQVLFAHTLNPSFFFLRPWFCYTISLFEAERENNLSCQITPETQRIQRGWIKHSMSYFFYYVRSFPHGFPLTSQSRTHFPICYGCLVQSSDGSCCCLANRAKNGEGINWTIWSGNKEEKEGEWERNAVTMKLRMNILIVCTTTVMQTMVKARGSENSIGKMYCGSIYALL